MANFNCKQVTQLYPMHPARDIVNPALHPTGSIDLIFSKAYDLGLLDDIRLKSIKPEKPGSRRSRQYESRVRILTKGAIFRRA